MITIKNPGLQTTTQDLGRFGWYKIGMPPSGAMDQLSLRVGNHLVGNPADACALETTFIGPELEFGRDTVFAVTGAAFDLKLNGTPIPMWVAHGANRGDVLTCGDAQQGVRSYICFAGGIDIPPLLGSRSTYLLASFGGVEGRRLIAGDVLPLGSTSSESFAMAGRRFDTNLLPRLGSDVELRVVVGLCSYRLTDESLQSVFDSVWQVSTEADRVGYRFKGPTLKFKEREPPFGAGSNPSNVVDVGYPVGSIQVPGGLEAILLMRDAVTGGGYATICTVIQRDLDRVAQLPPGSKVRLREVTIDQAIALRKEYSALLASIAHSIEFFDRIGLLGQ
ncbi:MAG: allophanate hydrolase [Candidatus Binatus sp.]|jgi:biotin-dependent carboxylase-like uncharacterized protein|nr:allophanate hydrolase [Candidatus Binatus sp.]